MNRKYSGDGGNFATNVDRDGARYWSGSQKVQSMTLDDLGGPQMPERVLIQIGIDVGKVGDPSAVSVAEWAQKDDGWHFYVRRLERLPLGLSYPTQADRLIEILEGLRKMSAKWQSEGTGWLDILPVLDTTGVGIAMLDLLTERGEAGVQAVSLTATDKLQKRADDDAWSLGKSVLVSSLLVAIQSGRVHLPQGTDAEALVRELSSFRMETTPSGHVTFNAASGTHDDLLIALGLSTLPGLRPKDGGGYLGFAVVRGGGL